MPIPHIWNEFNRYFQFLRKINIKWLAGITAPAQAFQVCSITGGGTGTDAVTFSDIYENGQQLINMADATYKTFISGEFAASQGDVVYPDLSSRAVTGFNVIGLGNNEVCHVIVVGRTAGMPDPTAA